MNIKQLQFAKSVAESKSFSKAAEVCHASQPTLSNAISLLEDQLGGRLFVRTTRKVDLTAFGEYMLPYIQTMLADLQELEQAADAYHNRQQKMLRIGLSPLIDMQRLDQILAPFRQSNPQVKVFFKECLLDDMQARMASDQIDVVVAPSGMLTSEQPPVFFYEEPLYYLPKEDAVNRKKQFQYKLNDLPDSQIILTGGGCGLNGSLEKLLKNENIQLNSYPGQALSYKVIEEWASLGIGAGILPRAKISKDNKFASPLMKSDSEAAIFSYEWIIAGNTVVRNEVSIFVDYLLDVVPALINGESHFGIA